MNLSTFGKKFTTKTGILELMDDLGGAMEGKEKKYMLGGGNPAHIKEVNSFWRKRMIEILKSGDKFEKLLCNYDAPHGKSVFLNAFAELLHREFNWPVTEKNIAVTSGSQSAFFYLLNMFSGVKPNGKIGKILFPLMPEYIGYASQSIQPDCFKANKPEIKMLGKNCFKYYIDFSNLDLTDVSAICVSRPTNPTGNVLTDEEIKKLSDIAVSRGIPLIIDNAYGAPFPYILFEEVNPIWNENIVLSMSLSKLGLPGVRTGIVIADEKIIEVLSGINAVLNLSNCSIGQELVLPFIESGKILQISKEIIKPFYQDKSKKTIVMIKKYFGNSIDYAVHKSEGALFLWIWFKNLPITTMELYNRLKKRKVIVVPGKYFFFGLRKPWEHENECIRINYSQDDKDIEEGIKIIADEIGKI